MSKPRETPSYTLEFPAELPVSQRVGDISHALRDHQVIIVAGETGSGKTTQLPKIALKLGRERIAHTQPRRIAARAVAERIAEETQTKLGDLVGYQVRFTDESSAQTQIKVMTDGILLNAIHHDRLLKAYDTIIIDEAHERSLNIDFLLGYLKTILPKRPDLKVIITSATIDPESFSKHFDDAPMISVTGRTYPVEVRYRPLITEREVTLKNGSVQHQREERDLFDGIIAAVSELRREGSGDILVFLSGEAEIRDAQEALLGAFSPGGPQAGRGPVLQVLPLFGRLSARDQHRIFTPTPAGQQRVVLATNVAETSLTVPGITYVIDAGTARISRYSTRSKVQRLPIEAISQASAQQRSGRSGRLRPGIAIRLYSEEDFLSRPEFTDPEILRTGLASVILQMMLLGLGDIAKFPFLTPPDSRGVRDGLTLLQELGAVRGQRITGLGRRLARLPIEPRFGRMLLEAERLGVTKDVTALVAGLTIQDVRERPEAERAQADQQHARFHDPQGDIMSLLNLWAYLCEQRDALSSSQFRKQCRSEFLNFLRVREWMDLTKQLSRALSQLPKSKGQDRRRHRVNNAGHAPSGDHADLVHQALLAGLLSHIGVRDEIQRAERKHLAKQTRGKRRASQEYVGARGTRFTLHPGSALAKQPPETVMTVELVETSRVFARMNAKIDPAWAERLAGDLAKRNYSEPRWQKSRGSAVALERVTLFGVPIVTERPVQLARIDRPAARQLFIRHALVDGEWDASYSFERHNRQLYAQLEQLESRTRTRGLIGDDEALYAFYDRRLPESVATQSEFQKWWQTVSKREPKCLHMSREDLITEQGAEHFESGETDAEFPREWHSEGGRLPLRYRFEPGAADDGITVTVPLPLLPALDPHQFEELVPGMRHELVTALIRSLPKAIRKHVVPAGDWATTLLGAIESDLARPGTSLTDLLAKEIRRRVSVPVTRDDFDQDRLPEHLKPGFRIVDQRGRTVARGKNLTELKAKHQGQASKGAAAVAARSAEAPKRQRSGLTAWPGGNLSREVQARLTERGGDGTVRAHPALVDKKAHVDLMLLGTEAEQRAQHRLGVRRLVLLSTPSLTSYVLDHLTNDEKLLLSAGPYRSAQDAITDLTAAVADDEIRATCADGLVWAEADFTAITASFERNLERRLYEGIQMLCQVLREARTARKAIGNAKALHVLSQVTDATAQLDQLVWAQGNGSGFLSRTGLQQLDRLPVYLQAITLRMRELTANPGKDRARQNDIDKAVKLYTAAGGEFPHSATASDELVAVRWMLEELRVSVFAQSLRTRGKVSLQRIQSALDTLTP